MTETGHKSSKSMLRLHWWREDVGLGKRGGGSSLSLIGVRRGGGYRHECIGPVMCCMMHVE